MPLAHVPDRPEGITCVDYEKDPTDPRGRRCRYYLDGGTCQMPSRFVCEEWQKRFGPTPPTIPTRSQETMRLPLLDPDPLPPPPPPPALAALVTPAQAAAAAAPLDPVGPDGALRLTPSEVRRPSAAKERARQAYALAGGEGTAEAVVLDPPPGPPIPWLDPLRVAELATTCREVHLLSEALGDVWLVKDKTAADRMELSFDEAALLTTIVATFPGARLVELRKSRNPIPQGSDSDVPGMPGVPGTPGTGEAETPGDRPQTAEPQGAAKPRCWGCDAVEVAANGDLCEACEA